MLEWVDRAQILAPQHANDWISGLCGAGGAIMGSLVTVTWTEFFNRRTRARDQREKIRVAAFSLFQKLNRIYSDAIFIKRHFDSGFAVAAQNEVPFLSQSLLPITIHDMSVHFSIDELWMTTKVETVDLINVVNTLDEQYNALTTALKRYDAERNALFDELRPAEMEGNRGVIRLTPEEDRRFRPKFVKQDMALKQMKVMADILVEGSYTALRGLVYARKMPLGKKFGCKITTPAGEGVELRAKDAPRADAFGALIVLTRRWGARLLSPRAGEARNEEASGA